MRMFLTEGYYRNPPTCPSMDRIGGFYFRQVSDYVNTKGCSYLP